MMLDYNSLLLALGVSATCLTLTALGSWLARRAETFLLTCTVGLVLVVSGIFTYVFYVEQPGRLLGAANFVLLHGGFATIWGAGYQFRTNRLPLWGIVIRAFLAMASAVPSMIVASAYKMLVGDVASVAPALLPQR